MGGLAVNYLKENKQDSALWAFNEGKRRGGYLDAFLHLGRTYLKKAKLNSILISQGDIITLPLYYLQEVEGLRPDVLTMDANIFSTGWFPIYFRKQKGLALSFTDEQLHRMPLYRLWRLLTVVVKNPKKNQAKIQWIVELGLLGSYLHRQSEVLLEVYNDNLYKRPIGFTGAPDAFSSLSLDKNLVFEGLITYIAVRKEMLSYGHTINKSQKYSLGTLTQTDILRSDDGVHILNQFLIT